MEQHRQNILFEALRDLAVHRHEEKIPAEYEWFAQRVPRSLGLSQDLLQIMDQEGKPVEEQVPTGLHRVEQVWPSKKASVPSLAVKTIDENHPANAATRMAKIFQFLDEFRRPTVKFIGYIANLGTLGERHPYRAKIFTEWSDGAKPLDAQTVKEIASGERAGKFERLFRRNILAQLGEHFAFFHGAWESREEKQKPQRQRQKPRWYVEVTDCRMENFLLDSDNAVRVLDPETWNLSSKPLSRAAKDHDIYNILRQAYKHKLVENQTDVHTFVDMYLGRHLESRKNGQWEEKANDLTRKIWNSIRQDATDEDGRVRRY